MQEPETDAACQRALSLSGTCGSCARLVEPHNPQPAKAFAAVFDLREGLRQRGGNLNFIGHIAAKAATYKKGKQQVPSCPQRRKPSRLAILVRPEPSKSSCGQQGEDESVEGFLQSHAPWLALPDGVAQISQAISQKRRRADHAEHRGIFGTQHH